jgi:hypothetical protein
MLEPKELLHFISKSLAIAVLAAFCLQITAGEKSQPQKPDFVLNNFADGYRCTFWINGEPIYSSSGFFLRPWNGYPLKRGENQIRFEAQSLHPDDAVVTSTEISSSNALKTVRLTLAKPNIDVTETVHLNATPALPTILLDDLAATTNEVELLKQFTLNLAQATARRDIVGMAKLLRVNPNELRFSYPRWFSESAKPPQSSSVASAKDLDILIGKRLLVIRPTIDYARAKAPSLATVKSIEAVAEITLPCMIFSRQANAWFCLAPNSQWIKIQEAVQDTGSAR